MNLIADTKDTGLWVRSDFLLEFFKAMSFAAFAIIVNYYAVRYATHLAGPAVPDFVLNRVPRVDTAFLHSYGALYLEYLVLVFAFIRTRSLIFFLKSMSLVIIVRDIFINMTNLGIPAGTVPTTSFFTQGGDLFFSGHTALPFMAALIFWHMPAARYTLLTLTLILATEVLIGHQHYTIDVCAAPFIVWGVFSLSKYIFPADYASSIS